MIGEIDLATAPRFRAELHAALHDAPAIAIDLSDCDLVDSVGLGVIVGAARRARTADRRLVVVATGAAARALEASRVDRIVDVVDRLEDVSSVVGEAS